MIRILTNDPVSVPGGSWGFGQLQLSFYLYGKLEIAQCLELSVIYCPQCDLVGVASIKGKTLSQSTRISMINDKLLVSSCYLFYEVSFSDVRKSVMQLSNPNKSMHSLSRSQRLFYQSFLVRGHMQRVPLQPMQCFHFFPSPKRWAKRKKLWSFDENCHLPPTMLLTGFVLT